MKDILIDIQAKLKEGVYKNEEHIRLSLVLRILQHLGWDIWNPIQVNAEYVAVPTEDKTKVDLALFANLFSPSVFMEIKALGQIESHLPEIEIQLRNYNRNNTALFSVITDGCKWRFYYSQTGGEFSQKCFRTINLLQDNLEDVEQSLSMFLGKGNIESGAAKQEAENYLQSSQRQRVLADCLSQARRSIVEPPYPSLPDSLVALVGQRGFAITREEAVAFINEAQDKPVASQLNPDAIAPRPSPVPSNKVKVEKLDPDNLGDLRFTRILQGEFGGDSANDWRGLLEIGVRCAIERGVQLSELTRKIGLNLKQGNYGEKGFALISHTHISMQGLSAANSAKSLILLGKLLHCDVYVLFEWRGESESPFAGQQARIEWKS